MTNSSALETAVPSECPLCRGPLGPLSRCHHCGVAAVVRGYRVQRLLSQTPHARLYAAEDSQGAHVALKELLFSVVPDVQQVDAFEREAALLAALQHPRIPHFLASFREGEGIHTRLYLVQELIDGMPLEARLREGVLNEAEMVDLARQVLPILAYLHGRTPKVVHRDLKPANLMLDRNGRVALIDFGVARHLAHGATHGATLVGTFGYMPPEQLGGTVDETSDLYALGATLVHAVTGLPPELLLRDGQVLDFAGHTKMSPARCRFLSRLTAPRAADRYRSAQEALSALESGPNPPRRARIATVIGSTTLAATGAVLLLLHSTAAPVAPSPVLTESANTVEAPSPRPPPASLPVIPESHPSSDIAMEEAQRQVAQRAEAMREMEKEVKEDLKSLFVAQKAYFGSNDRYTEQLDATGFVPEEGWCPDGARKSIRTKSTPTVRVGCHFIYKVKVEGQCPECAFIATARGAAGLALGMVYRVSSDGEDRGIPIRVSGPRQATSH